MTNPWLKRFGARVKTERERQTLSQEALAERAGLHRTYISDVERGARNIGLVNVIKIAKALGVSASTLVSAVDSRSGRQ